MEIGGKSYGQYRGMGSMAAMKAGSAARYGHTSDGTRKVAPEGVEALKEVSGSVDRVHSQLIGGLQSGLGWSDLPCDESRGFSITTFCAFQIVGT